MDYLKKKKKKRRLNFKKMGNIYPRRTWSSRNPRGKNGGDGEWDRGRRRGWKVASTNLPRLVDISNDNTVSLCWSWLSATQQRCWVSLCDDIEMLFKFSTSSFSVEPSVIQMWGLKGIFVFSPSLWPSCFVRTSKKPF